VSDLLKLAERCERIAKPSRDLDRAIWLAVVAGEADKQAYKWGLAISRDEARFRADYMMDGASYTASLDAAMKLVPEGLHVTHAGEARFMTRSPAFAVTVEEWGSEQADDGSEIATRPLVRHGVAATFPLALCAAALKARASMSHGEKE
jgi:hypothetical protein